ncbi:YpfB family protein [Neobacillus mesonae]|uniref:YpfB family protein n=1 Tax=Neobacillus mesonae TaxID=1193713 RepID=UPI002573728A|nr:YpfB family protein [Neobacillus mesonae]MED4204233.1 YpfB family protein [Neobacillus mesonae]
MKKIERLLIKLIIVQFIFLLVTQFFFHQLDLLPEVKELAKYEGVNENTFTDILQTIKEK